VWQSQSQDGTVESGQRVRIGVAAVPFDEQGARALGSVYWAVVERASLGIVRRRRSCAQVELRLFGVGWCLLRFGPSEVAVSATGVACTFPIAGGLLARRPQGLIRFEQRRVGHEAVGVCELSSTVEGFVPRLAARPGEPHRSGALYTRVQSRIHVWISRRYFDRLTVEVGQ
jgi:hypothetical protein